MFIFAIAMITTNLKGMEITEKSTNGCDRLSRVYGNMFNALQELMQNEDKLKELTPIDYSAIGLYIGKFVEQEINSSVVQLMRYFCGVDMPEYYCKRYPGFDKDVNTDVTWKNKTIRLNEQKDKLDSNSLKSVSLGDAYYALKQLKDEDSDDFFKKKYPWLDEEIFLEAWRNLFVFRNKMAHIGELIDADTLKKNYMFFQRFLNYMPNILELKKKLAPEDYIETLPAIQEKKEEERPYFVTTDNKDLPYAPMEIAKRFCELNEKRDNTQEEIDEMNGYLQKYYILDAIIFKGPDGKKGLKDCLGKILAPAKYDGFGFIPKPIDFPRKSVIAIRDDKYYLVALDGSGKEFTKVPCDEIRLIMYEHMGSPYIYRKRGLKAWGLMDLEGNEICDCIIDDYAGGNNSVFFESGDKQGYWQFYGIYLPPIYDNIELEDLGVPLIFTLDGVQGYVNYDGIFISLADYKMYEEKGEYDLIDDLVMEESGAF